MAGLGGVSFGVQFDISLESRVYHASMNRHVCYITLRFRAKKREKKRKKHVNFVIETVLRL